MLIVSWAATASGASWAPGRAAPASCSTPSIFRGEASCLFETGSVRTKKNVICLILVLSVVGPILISVVGLAHNPAPEFTEDGHYHSMSVVAYCINVPCKKTALVQFPHSDWFGDRGQLERRAGAGTRVPTSPRAGP